MRVMNKQVLMTGGWRQFAQMLVVLTVTLTVGCFPAYYHTKVPKDFLEAFPRDATKGAEEVLAIPEWSRGLGPPVIVEVGVLDTLPDSLKDWWGVGVGDLVHPWPDGKPNFHGILMVVDSGQVVRMKHGLIDAMTPEERVGWTRVELALAGPRIKHALTRILVERDSTRSDAELVLGSNFGHLRSDPEAMAATAPEQILGSKEELAAMATFLEALPTDGDDEWHVVEPSAEIPADSHDETSSR